MRVSVAVMAHTARQEMAERLVKKLEHEFEGKVELFVDDGSLKAFGNAVRAWAASPADATHRLLVQDDAILCSRFASNVKAVINEVPTNPIALMMFGGAPQRAVAAGKHWVVRSHTAAAQATILPTAYAHHFAAWAPQHIDDRQDDTALSVWCILHKKKVWTPVPTLVDHDVSVGSENGNADRLFGKERVSSAFLGDKPTPRWQGTSSTPYNDGGNNIQTYIYAMRQDTELYAAVKRGWTP